MKRTLIFLFAFLYAFSSIAQLPSFDDDKPETTFNAEYHQEFNPEAGWDAATFYGYWHSHDPNIFSAEDIQAGYLQFVWVPKRIIYSKMAHIPPYVMQADISHGQGSHRAGVVIRANPLIPDHLQEPAQGDPGFNSEGIAFYPNLDGSGLIVQFTGVYNANNTPVTQITIPKPENVSSLLNRGLLRVEDFGESIYVYYNDQPFVRINLDGLSNGIYTSGTVFNAQMQVAGTFSNMQVEAAGIISVAQRDAALRLYSAIVSFNELEHQYIQFDHLSKKFYNDAPFSVWATATSGLPVSLEIISGPATIEGNLVTLTGDIGIIAIRATQGGDNTYYPASSVIRYIYVSDPAFANALPGSQDYVDNWVATDALGRYVVNYEQAGPIRENKTVGVFYFVWQGFHGNTVNDMTKIIESYPDDPLSPANPNWGPIFSFHWWGEPEAGYHRAEDPWIIRRDMQMLANAKVDFIFIDVTNAVTYDEEIRALCEVSLQMRKEGIYTPEIAFCTNTRSGEVMNYLYDSFYASSLFDELWFSWEGKPLILGNFNDPELRDDVRDFFTIKYSWAWTNTTAEPNHWQWLDSYPQDYGWSADPAVAEQIPVAVAHHPENPKGTSFHNGQQPPVDANYLTEFTGQGLHFAEQWTRAHQVDPEVIMVTQWNEWIAQRFIWDKGPGYYAGRPIKDGDSYFVDVLTQEFHRDMAPMKGGHTDNYYYQLVSNIRKFKGMNPWPHFSPPVSMDINGDLSKWDHLEPVFRDPAGDVMHRHFRGYEATTMYINNTGRNDIIESRVAYDQNNLYFFVKTVEDITPHTDPSWMFLLLDIDRNKGTGWEGYDFVVNHQVISESITTLKRWNGLQWSDPVQIEYAVNGNGMELSIPLEALFLSGDNMPEFYFKWADNTGSLTDISDFFLYGDVAPDRRFNFNYSMSDIEILHQTPFKDHQIPGTIEFEDFDNGGAGVAYADATFGNSGGKYRIYESVDIAEKQEDEYYVGWVYTNEWLEYTLTSNAIGVFTATIHYAATNDTNMATIYVNGSKRTDTITFPATGGTDTWGSIDVDVRFASGKQVLRFFIDNAEGEFNLDKIVFTEKDVIYPGQGTGLWKSYWTAAAGGRNWFIDSVCAEPVQFINENWGNTSPGCDISNDFWNARWHGQIEPLYSENYTFFITVSDQARLWINDEMIINAWTGASTGQTHQGSIDLLAGEKYDLRVDYAKRTGDAYIRMEWESPSNPRETVPMSQLYLSHPLLVSNTAHMGTFAVFPNPATNQLTVNIGKDSAQALALYDTQGRKVFEEITPFTGEKTIHLSLEKGVYFVKLTSKTPYAMQKIIVQ